MMLPADNEDYIRLSQHCFLGHFDVSSDTHQTFPNAALRRILRVNLQCICFAQTKHEEASLPKRGWAQLVKTKLPVAIIFVYLNT